MWWEAIPSMAIITVGLWIPHIATKGLHLLMFDHPFKRDMTTGFQRQMYSRDGRVGGAPYNVVGLEGLSDEPQKL